MLPHRDPKLRTGAKLTDGKDLYEVVETKDGKTLLEDCYEPVDQCSTIRIDSWRLKTAPWRLVGK